MVILIILWITGMIAGIAGGRYMFTHGNHPVDMGWGAIIVLLILSLLMSVYRYQVVFKPTVIMPDIEVETQ